KEANHAALPLAGTQQQNVAHVAALVVLVHVQLVGRDQRQTAPGQERRAEQGGGWWRYAAARAFTTERGDRLRMREEERRLFPDLGDQVVQVIRGGRTDARGDALGRNDVAQQAIVRVVDQLALLALFDH